MGSLVKRHFDARASAREQVPTFLGDGAPASWHLQKKSPTRVDAKRLSGYSDRHAPRAPQATTPAKALESFDAPGLERLICDHG
jgi:hypothetical protein